MARLQARRHRATRSTAGFEPGQANEVFGVFADDSAAVLTAAATDLDDQLADAADPLGGARTVVLLLTLFAAIAVIFGFNQRMKEYR